MSLGIRPVLSESSLSAWRNTGSLATHWAHSKDWSDWADAQADVSLCWADMPFCLFYHEAAQIHFSEELENFTEVSSNKEQIWARAWQNLSANRGLESAWAFAQSDQSSLSTWRKLVSLATHRVHSKDSDQTGWMSMLIWVFTGCTSFCRFRALAHISMLVGLCDEPTCNDRFVCLFWFNVALKTF